ncbi:hypothetical protein HMI56_005350 [Coelomomyces lativittatus]|nr:hypothetical protein HMI56_005350 [Coelomomyces lativittatus]
MEKTTQEEQGQDRVKKRVAALVYHHKDQSMQDVLENVATDSSTWLKSLPRGTYKKEGLLTIHVFDNDAMDSSFIEMKTTYSTQR